MGTNVLINEIQRKHRQTPWLGTNDEIQIAYQDGKWRKRFGGYIGNNSNLYQVENLSIEELQILLETDETLKRNMRELL